MVVDIVAEVTPIDSETDTHVEQDRSIHSPETLTELLLWVTIYEFLCDSLQVAWQVNTATGSIDWGEWTEATGKLLTALLFVLMFLKDKYERSETGE